MMNQTMRQNYRSDCYSNSNHFANHPSAGYPAYGGAGGNGRPHYKKALTQVESGSGTRSGYQIYGIDCHDYEVYNRRSPATKGNRVGNLNKCHLPEDVFYNPDKNMIYVKKGEDCITPQLHRSTSQGQEPDRLSSYSTNSSDEDGTARQTQSPQVIELNFSPKCKKGKFKAFEVFFNEEHIALYSDPKNTKGKKNREYVASGQSYQLCQGKFGGSEMKSGPLNLEVIPVPSFSE